MDTSTCASCKASTTPHDVVAYGSLEKGYRTLCGRCFNTLLATELGLHDFEHLAFEPVCMVDARGVQHEFRFRTLLLVDGVCIDAFEIRDGEPFGYSFQVIGPTEGDHLELLAKLIVKMRRALALTHLEESDHGPHVNDGRVLRGTITHLAGDPIASPAVVVDGREFSWDELGRMVSSFEGWQFKLEFVDRSREI